MADYDNKETIQDSHEQTNYFRKRRSKGLDGDDDQSSYPHTQIALPAQPLSREYEASLSTGHYNVIEPDISQFSYKKPKTEIPTDIPQNPYMNNSSLLRTVPQQYVTNFSIKPPFQKMLNPYPGMGEMPYQTSTSNQPRMGIPYDFSVPLPSERTLPWPGAPLPPTMGAGTNNSDEISRRMYSMTPTGMMPSTQTSTGHPYYYPMPSSYPPLHMDPLVSSNGPNPYSYLNNSFYDSWYFDNNDNNGTNPSSTMRNYYGNGTTTSQSPSTGHSKMPSNNIGPYDNNDMILPNISQRQSVHNMSNSYLPATQQPNRFGLLQQPQEIQRKSYKTENRCLLPNPLVVSAVVFSTPMPRILRGTVTAKLVSQHGTDLPNDKQKLLDSLSGSLTEPLDESLCANFSLKLLETSEGHQWRLKFIVRYETDMGDQEEEFLSKPFVVYSNRRKNQTLKNTNSTNL